MKRGSKRSSTAEEKALLAELRVNGVIRIQSDEYQKIPSGILGHFNLEVCYHKPGLMYALPKILKTGSFKPSTGEEVLPELDYSNCLIGRCLEVEEHLSYEDLIEKHFAHSMSHIQTVQELQAAIWKRYHQSMPELSRDQMMKLGVSWTLLELI